MKTFEEAMKATFVRNSKAEALAGCEDVISRYGAMFEEIAANEMTSRFLQMVCETPPIAGLTEEEEYMSIVVSIFCNGVMVGIEMEKPE